MFAGQVTGVEGYVESAAMGLLSGIFLSAEIFGKNISKPTNQTAIGALLNHITIGHESKSDFQPMNVNFGMNVRTGLQIPSCVGKDILILKDTCVDI